MAHDVQTVFWQIAETYAFLPREAVTRFLMSCTECQKRMHFNSSGPEPKGGGHAADRSSRGHVGGGTASGALFGFV